ncbi:MAG: KEOPS complex subunit Pcc1 [Candidatus Bathyarchaeota archaeon]|nr:KEOPS complex subunit Pcc1 [Candidatus Bathyarchaeota archaeon]
MEATITLKYIDEGTAQAVADAVSPDNYKTPSGLEIKTVREKDTVVTRLKCECKLATLTATIDDLLCSVSIAEKTLNSINIRQLGQ